MSAADIHYVRTSDGVDIAYQVIGDRPIDLVVIPQIVSNLEWEWEQADCRNFYERLATFARVIRFDKRGMGMSDRIGDVAPTFEQRIEDVRSVMDATGSQQATVMGISEGGGVGCVYAASEPSRVRSLILCGSPYGGIGPSPDERFTDEMFEILLDTLGENWGTGAMTLFLEPSSGLDPIRRQWWGRLERLSGTPKNMQAVFRMNRDSSIVDVIPLVQTPTLLLYREHEILIEHGRRFAQTLPSATLIELPGPDHIPWLGEAVDATVDAIQTFVTGKHPQPRTDRALATVLFTDVAQSTARTADLGDRKWRSLLDELDRQTGRAVETWNGRLVKQTGDGHLATFLGPTSAIHLRVGDPRLRSDDGYRGAQRPPLRRGRAPR